jgi:hypothetical protein
MDWWKKVVEWVKGILPEAPQLFKVLTRPSDWIGKFKIK